MLQCGKVPYGTFPHWYFSAGKSTNVNKWSINGIKIKKPFSSYCF